MGSRWWEEREVISLTGNLDEFRRGKREFLDGGLTRGSQRSQRAAEIVAILKDTEGEWSPGREVKLIEA